MHKVAKSVGSTDCTVGENGLGTISFLPAAARLRRLFFQSKNEHAAAGTDLGKLYEAREK